MTGIIDYGVGNLFSLRSSFAAIGEETRISSDPAVLAAADRLVLPGVGAFEDAAKKLRQTGLSLFVKEQYEKEKPILGICLGMQLLFESSAEYGCHEGLGLLRGKVVPIGEVAPAGTKVPHIGWNVLQIRKESRLFRYVQDGEYVYFVHSFCAVGCEDSLLALTDYGAPITAAVEKNRLYGCQFHPEKSGEVGLKILKGFCTTGGKE